MLSKAFPFLSIIVLLFPMIVFTLAAPPLLVLKHDTPVDGLFIRNLFSIYHIVVMVLAALGAAGCAWLGKGTQALAMGGVIVVVFLIRRGFVLQLDAVRHQIASGDAGAIRRFRRLHLGGLALNIVQVGVVAWGLSRLVA